MFAADLHTYLIGGKRIDTQLAVAAGRLPARWQCPSNAPVRS